MFLLLLDECWRFLLSAKLSGLGEVFLRATCSCTWCFVASERLRIGTRPSHHLSHHPFPLPLPTDLPGPGTCSQPSWQCWELG